MMVKKPVVNVMPKDMEGKAVEIPEYLLNMSRTRGDKSRNIAKLAGAIKAIFGTGKGFPYKVADFANDFGGVDSKATNYVKFVLRSNHGITRPVIVIDNGVVWCWANELKESK